MVITIKDYSDTNEIEFDYIIDDADIKRFLVEILESELTDNFENWPEHLPVIPFEDGTPYTVNDYADEYLDELMEIDWYYDYVYNRVMDEFGDEIWEAYRDSEELRKDPYSYYGVKRSDF